MTLETAGTAPPVRVIELAGLPGTGKSTVAQRLESIFGEAGIPIISKSAVFADRSRFMHRQRKRLQLIIRNARQCRHLYRRSLGLIADSRQKSALDFGVVASNFWSVAALMAEGRACDDRVMIVDQGLVQAIWSVQLSSLRALSLDAWAPLLQAAGIAETLLAHVETETSVSRHRVSTRTRNWSRLESGNSDERSLQWQVASKNMSDLVDWAQRTIPRDQYGARVLTIMNHEGAPEVAAAEIASAYFTRNPSRARASNVRQPQERSHEDRLSDHPDGQHRRGTNPRPGSFTMAETKRT